MHGTHMLFPARFFTLLTQRQRPSPGVSRKSDAPTERIHGGSIDPLQRTKVHPAPFNDTPFFQTSSAIPARWKNSTGSRAEAPFRGTAREVEPLVSWSCTVESKERPRVHSERLGDA